MTKEIHLLTKAPRERVIEVLTARGYKKDSSFGDNDYVRGDNRLYLEIQERKTEIEERLEIYGDTSIPYPNTILVGDLDAIGLMGESRENSGGLQDLVMNELSQIRDMLPKEYKTEIHEVDKFREKMMLQFLK